MVAQAENAQWFKGKIPIIAEYSETHRAMLSTIAGRGFCHAPGYLFEASIALEEVGKNKLSALNYTIVTEAVQRRIAKIDRYLTQTFETVRSDFEFEKQTLLVALQNEFADLDATQSLKKEELDRRFVELDIRKIILITTKTAIELQLEALKQELTAVDRLTSINEEALVNEKVATATAKLAVIPHLEALIVEQRRALSAEESNIPSMEILIAEKGLLFNKEAELIPDLVVRTAKQELLAEALSQQITFKEQMLTAAIDKILLKTDIVDNRIAILDAEILVEDMRQLLNTEKHNLHEAKLGKEIELLSTDTENLAAIDVQRDTTLTALQEDKAQLRTDSAESERDIVSADIAMAGDIKTSQIAEEKGLIVREKITRVADIKDSADAAASAEITSKLIHIIGS